MMRTYDPGRVIISLFGANITGFADGTFIKIERNSDTFVKTVGADGKVARARQRDRSARITLTLLQTSPSNDVLSAAAEADEIAGTGVGTFLMTDLNGTTEASAPNAWVAKPAAIEDGKEVGEREWMIDVDELDQNIGGQLLL